MSIKKVRPLYDYTQDFPGVPSPNEVVDIQEIIIPRRNTALDALIAAGIIGPGRGNGNGGGVDGNGGGVQGNGGGVQGNGGGVQGNGHDFGTALAGISLPGWLVSWAMGLITKYGIDWVTGLLGIGETEVTTMANGTQTGVIPYDAGYIDGIPLVGPGVPEPPPAFVKRRWETYSGPGGNIKCNFYALTNGKIAMYHNTYRYWKIWRPRKNIVLSSDPRISNLVKLERAHQKFMKLLAKKSKSLKLQRG